MSGFFLLRDDPGRIEATLATAGDTLVRQGLPAPVALPLPGWHLLHAGSEHTRLVDGDDWVALAGTIEVDGAVGRAALARLLAMERTEPSRIGGHFAAIVRRAGRTRLLLDPLAHYQVFRDIDHRLFSTSLVAAATALPRVRFDPQGVYEFAFNVVPVGDATVLHELALVGAREIVALDPDGANVHALPPPPAPVTDDRAPGERLAAHRDRLLAAVAPFARAHGDAIFCPLSGGLDSRLLLASLRACGSAPRVYVYGPGGSADVDIARAIGRAHGFAVEWIDKARAPLAPDAFPEVVARNFDAFDALPTYGNIFDNGGHLAAMEARHAGGALAASGGGGEVYRDFFYLPDRPLAALDVARSFFARFDARDATALFDPPAFVAGIADKIATALGAPDARTPLPRPLIEQAYPRIRTRALFGRELSLESRRGSYLLPFLDHRLVAEAASLPLAERAAGRFEAALLTSIDPALAAEPSAYGHPFNRPPGRRHRWSEAASRRRPIWLRQRSYALQRRWRAMGDEHGGLLSPDYMARVIDLSMPAMRRFFHVERITDAGLWRRLAALEYLAGRLGSRLQP